MKQDKKYGMKLVNAYVDYLQLSVIADKYGTKTNVECDKSCGIGQYLDHKSCVCRNSLVDKLVEECTSAIDADTIYNKTLKVTLSNDCASCTPYVVLFALFLSTSIIISSAFIYFHWYKNKQFKK